MKSTHFKALLVSEMVLMLLVTWTKQRLVGWEAFSPAEFAASRDAYYSISNLYLRFGVYLGCCCGVAGVGMATLVLAWKKSESRVMLWIRLLMLSIPAIISIVLSQQV